LRKRLAEIRSRLGKPREKLALMSRQRIEKSASPAGNVQTGMDMVRQHHDGIDRERVAPRGVPERRPQQFDIVGE
jgi:hypothetical protein